MGPSDHQARGLISHRDTRAAAESGLVEGGATAARAAAALRGLADALAARSYPTPFDPRAEDDHQVGQTVDQLRQLAGELTRTAPPTETAHAVRWANRLRVLFALGDDPALDLHGDGTTWSEPTTVRGSPEHER